ncbi:MAG: HEPN domain-containing protein [Thermodesulfobacteriota bacterium]
MKNEGYVAEWMKRARSNLERAKVGRISDAIMYEDLCFDCQQAAEKSIKALLISRDKKFPPIHSIAGLLEIVADAGIDVPQSIQEAVILTDYAVKTRYPGEGEPVTKEEYEESVDLAIAVYDWVCKIIEGEDS